MTGWDKGLASRRLSSTAPGMTLLAGQHVCRSFIALIFLVECRCLRCAHIAMATRGLLETHLEYGVRPFIPWTDFGLNCPDPLSPVPPVFSRLPNSKTKSRQTRKRAESEDLYLISDARILIRGSIRLQGRRSSVHRPSSASIACG